MMAPDVVNSHEAPPTAPGATACGCARAAAAELEAWQAALLRDLAELGMTLARRVVEAPAEAPVHEPPTLAFERASRAVRLTLALQTQISRDAAQAAAKAPAADTPAAPAPPETARRAELETQLETIIAKEAPPRFVGRRIRQMRERLVDLAETEDFLNRPQGEIIAQICKDLGLDIDWRAWWAGEEWALEAGEAAGLDPAALDPVSDQPADRLSPAGVAWRARAIHLLLAKAAAAANAPDPRPPDGDVSDAA